jgi:hypothetical protein
MSTTHETRETLATRRALRTATLEGQRAQARRELEAFRESVRTLKRDRAALLVRVRAQCKTARERARAAAKARRAAALRALRTELREFRQAERNRCQGRKVKVRLDFGRRIGAKMAAAEQARRDQASVRRVDSHRRKAEAKAEAHEQRRESDDEVRQNLDADLVPIFDQMRSKVQARPGMSRTDAFTHWIAENESEVWPIREHIAQVQLGELMRAQRKADQAHARELGAQRQAERAERKAAKPRERAAAKAAKAKARAEVRAAELAEKAAAKAAQAAQAAAGRAARKAAAVASKARGRTRAGLPAELPAVPLPRSADRLLVALAQGQNAGKVSGAIQPNELDLARELIRRGELVALLKDRTKDARGAFYWRAEVTNKGRASVGFAPHAARGQGETPKAATARRAVAKARRARARVEAAELERARKKEGKRREAAAATTAAHLAAVARERATELRDLAKQEAAELREEEKHQAKLAGRARKPLSRKEAAAKDARVRIITASMKLADAIRAGDEVSAIHWRKVWADARARVVELLGDQAAADFLRDTLITASDREEDARAARHQAAAKTTVTDEAKKYAAAALRKDNLRAALSIAKAQRRIERRRGKQKAAEEAERIATAGMTPAEASDWSYAQSKARTMARFTPETRARVEAWEAKRKTELADEKRQAAEEAAELERQAELGRLSRETAEHYAAEDRDRAEQEATLRAAREATLQAAPAVTDEAKKYAAAVKRAAALIRARATGATSRDAMQNAVAKAESLARWVEPDEREAAWALRPQAVAADEAARVLRVANLEAEAARLRAAKREEWAGLGGYERELRLTEDARRRQAEQTTADQTFEKTAEREYQAEQQRAELVRAERAERLAADRATQEEAYRLGRLAADAREAARLAEREAAHAAMFPGVKVRSRSAELAALRRRPLSATEPRDPMREESAMARMRTEDDPRTPETRAKVAQIAADLRAELGRIKAEALARDVPF